MNPFAYLASADFYGALLKALPKGLAWQGAVQRAFIAAIADLRASFHAQVAQISEIEDNSLLTELLLPEWETDYGLPDACTPSGQTIVQRRAALNARITDAGGQSIPHFIAVAAQLGFAITITEYVPARAGQLCAGQACNGPPWIFVWRVNAALATLTRFAAGASQAGDPLARWGNAELECVIREKAPAHTLVLFAYS